MRKEKRQVALGEGTTLISTGWPLTVKPADVCLPGPGAAKTMADVEKKMPTEVIKELRRLAHDLSNALEAVVQATYLARQATRSDNTSRWLEVIDKSSQEAAQINQKLREILRSQS